MKDEPIGLYVVIFALCVLVGVLYLLFQQAKAQIEFIYSEWERSDIHKDLCIKAARYNLPPPGPIGRIIKEGYEPIRPRNYEK